MDDYQYDSTIASDFEVLPGTSLRDEDTDDIGSLYESTLGESVSRAGSQEPLLQSLGELLTSTMGNSVALSDRDTVFPQSQHQRLNRSGREDESTLNSSLSSISGVLLGGQAETKDILERALGKMDEVMEERKELQEKVSNLEAKVERLTAKNRKLQNVASPRESRTLNHSLRPPTSSPQSSKANTKNCDSVCQTEQEERPKKVNSVPSKWILFAVLLVVVCAALFYKMGESQHRMEELEQELTNLRKQLQGSKLELQDLQQSCKDEMLEINFEDSLDSAYEKTRKSSKKGDKHIENPCKALTESVEKYGQESRNLKDQDTVWNDVMGHWRNPEPQKPLVLSFHGGTGTGKNHVAKIIVDHLYKNGMNSSFVHHIMAIAEYPDNRKMDEYKVKLRECVLKSVSKCGRSTFIFDEIDKLPEQLLGAIKPFLDHYHAVMGTDFRRATFIFLSNPGGAAITQLTLKQHQSGLNREDLKLVDFERVIMEEVFNTEGGLRKSDVIANQLIDHFIPFLPLERQHVLLCTQSHMKRRGRQDLADNRDFLNTIVHSLQYFPTDIEVFSSSGCKRLDKKIDLEMSKRDPSGVLGTLDLDDM